jgi:hypothetical protein
MPQAGRNFYHRMSLSEHPKTTAAAEPSLAEPGACDNGGPFARNSLS